MTSYRAPQFSLAFTGPPADVAALARTGLLARAERADPSLAPRWRRARAVYFDAPDFRLARHGAALWRDGQGTGLAFRRRREDFFTPVTLFTGAGDGGAAPHAGSENRPQGNDRLDTDALARLSADQRLPIAVGGLLTDFHEHAASVGIISYDQWTAVLLYEGAVIEAQIAVGRAEETESDQYPPHRPYAELTLSLLSGEGMGLFALSRALIDLGANTSRSRLRPAGHAPFTPPFARYKALALETPVKAGAAPGERAADALAGGVAASAANLCVAAAALQDGAARGDDWVGGEAGRRARVAMRRFRAFEKLYRKAMNGGSLRRLAERARDYARLVGAGRDWDVFLSDTLPTLGALMADADPNGEGRVALAAQASDLRSARWREAAAALETTAFSHFLLDLIEAGLLAPWRAEADAALFQLTEDFAATALDKAYVRAEAAGAAAHLEDMDSIHGLRLELKKFRYAAQIFRGLYLKEHRKPFFEALADLQERLGVLNDAVVAQRLATEAAASAVGPEADAEMQRAAGFVAGATAARAEAAARAALPLWAALLERRPYWRSPPPGVDRAFDPGEL